VMMRRLSGIRQWIYWFFWLWLPIRRAAIITVVSSQIREEILRYVRVDQKKIRVIPNGLSSEFKYEPKKRSNSVGVILHVGTSDNKNLNRVIVACACRPYKLVILGKLNSRQTSLLEVSGIEYEEYSQLAREEVVAQYRNADIVVFPSLYEGFGFPIIEANAVGTPIITSDRHPMKDVAGSAAHLVDPEDANSIGKGIDKVMGDPLYRETLILNGFDNIKRFSIEETSRQYESLYRELYP
jgi:glycosyltransferase involved in cell wall biosynthesis